MTSRLNEETELLNQKIREFEQLLIEMRLGVSAKLAMGDCFLGFGKFGKHWCLVIVHGEDSTPLVNASREARVAAVDYFEALVKALQESAVEATARVTAARDKAEGVLRNMRKVSNESHEV